ncbi:hypothetical protein ILUMI_07995, partial [Ignelater luminosus]
MPHFKSLISIFNCDYYCNGQVYFIQDGMCIYNGSITNLVPFISSLGFECPINYSPADHIIETVQTIQDSTSVLVGGIKNGKINMKDFPTVNSQDNCNLNKSVCKTLKCKEETNLDIDFPTSSWTQFCILLSKMMLQLKRNKLLIVIQLFNMLLGLSLIGSLYYKIGNNGSYGSYNFMYCACLLIYFIYNYAMSTILSFPAEVEMLKREYFNRWYGLKPYFAAITFRSLPLMLICSTGIILSTYLLTDQPLTLDRFIRFLLAGFLTAATSEAFGLVIGSVCCIT